jgi:hypothetical protein
MKLTSLDHWAPFAFSAALSVIALVTYIATGLSGAWIPPFLCFLPMTFWLAAASARKTREQIKVLEARIRELLR